MPNFSRRLAAGLRRLFNRPLRWVAGAIDRRADVVLTTILRRELESHERESRQSDLALEALLREVVAAIDNAGRESRQSDLALNALLREVVRLQNLVEELLARQDHIEEESETVATTIPIRERSA